MCLASTKCLRVNRDRGEGGDGGEEAGGGGGGGSEGSREGRRGVACGLKNLCD